MELIDYLVKFYNIFRLYNFYIYVYISSNVTEIIDIIQYFLIVAQRQVSYVNSFILKIKKKVALHDNQRRKKQ